MKAQFLTAPPHSPTRGTLNMDRLREGFCWTKFGTEAGQDIDVILARKEAERQANDGVFLWGVGNSLGQSVIDLVRHTSTPQVLFSPMKAAPKAIDCEPGSLLLWTCGRTLDGKLMPLPPYSIVTSRAQTESDVTKRSHYAIVCASDLPLRKASIGALPFGRLRNFSSGAKLGFSQVTSVVKLVPDALEDAGPGDYDVAIAATMVYPYFVRLDAPRIIPAEQVGPLIEAMSLAAAAPETWRTFALNARAQNAYPSSLGTWDAEAPDSIRATTSVSEVQASLF